MADETSYPAGHPYAPGAAADATRLPEDDSRDRFEVEEPTSAGSSRPAAAPAPEPLIPPGSVLFGVYEILDRLGSGGMGDVYRARHRELGKPRAIKVMRPELALHPEALGLFLREAQALLDMRHDAVVHCNDLLTGEDGRVHLVMELVEGRTLSDLVYQNGPLEEEEVWALGARLAAGLEAAHRHNVVHRDVSPDNILLAEGRPELAKLIDFGIAKRLDDRTLADGFKGKLAYASPEQFGLFGGEVGPRSDLYSLGMVLLYAATGAPNPAGRTIADALEIRRRPVAIPDDLSSRLRRQLEALLAPDPADRPASAAGLFTASLRPRNARGLPWRLGVGVGLAAAIAGLAVVWFRPAPPSVEPIEEPVAIIQPVEPTKTAEITTTATLEPPPPPPVEPFERAVGALLRAQGTAPSGRARVWTTPESVRIGLAYSLHFEVPCDCEALLFSVSATGDSVNLIYPNPFEPAKRLAAGSSFQLPSSKRYTLEAVGPAGEDTLKLLLTDGRFNFPPPGIHSWGATRGDAQRVEELERLLAEAPISDSAETPLHVAP